MADNTTLNSGSGGDTIRDLDRAGVKTPVVALDLNPAGAETLMAGAMPVSAASLPLPTGAATSARQPALGTAGTAAADVLTIQGIASMTAVKVDGSAVTQPVSGTVTANVGTANGLALDATLTGGTQKTKLVDSGGTNVATVSAAGAVKVDGSAVTQPVSGTVGVSGSVAVTGTFWQATQPVSGTVAANPAAAASGGATPYHLVSAASTNATGVKGSAGVVYAVSAFNTAASARYLKLYDKASTPVPAGDTPVLTLLIPPSNGGFTLALPVGVQFAAGIGIAITGAMGDSDATAIGAGDVCVGLAYK